MKRDISHRTAAQKDDQTTETGQSTVEFALIIPLVIGALLFVIQVGLVVYAQLAVTHAAREAARVLVINPHADVGQLTRDSVALGTEWQEMDVVFQDLPDSDRQVICVTISYEIRPVIGVFGRLFDGLNVKGHAKMVSEY